MTHILYRGTMARERSVDRARTSAMGQLLPQRPPRLNDRCTSDGCRPASAQEVSEAYFAMLASKQKDGKRRSSAYGT